MRVPSATYRVQFNLNFRFADAERLIPYLHDLGISHLYSSPKDTARRGSAHGYDVADPMHINSELGTEEEFSRLVARLREYGMGLLLDIVPNHMAASPENPWWMDVLENGRASSFAEFFDIDWDAPGAKSPELQRNRIVVPLLSDLYGRVLLAQGIVLRFDDKGFHALAEGNRVPISPKTYAMILDPVVEALRAREPQDKSAAEKLGEILASLQSAERGAAQESNINHAKRELWQLYREESCVHAAVDEALAALNGESGNPASFERLDALLRSQAYRLAYWRTATEEINYRRFFDINDLIALRVEDARVFRTTHARILPLVADERISGLRVDHIDGLSDPREYLERLQQARRASAQDDSRALNVYVIVEKITSGAERLPADWPVAGTTGYDFLNALNTLFVDPDGARQLENIYRDFTGIHASFSETWYVRKKQVMEELFGSDIQVLSYRLGRLATMDPFGRDIPMRDLIRALKEITARLAVYRTYFHSLELLPFDRVHLGQAYSIARERTPANVASAAAFDFLARVFLVEVSPAPAMDAREWLDFLLRWQQFTGAVMAKGFEDTAFYVHHGLISLNEVGCNPFRRQMRFGVHAFHQYNAAALKRHPHTMNATSTHDTKWSEDVRARINVISELTREWQARLRRWSRLNKSQKAVVEGHLVPSPNEEVLIYQSLLGIWPLERDEENSGELHERVERYILKASREAKTHTSWVLPNEAHEVALKRFLAAIVDPESQTPFRSEFSDFLQSIAVYGACNALSQALLKITAPGVPDFFQGTELWRFSLTDPDNRRFVNFPRRTALLEELSAQKTGAPSPQDLLANWKDGRIKLFLTARALNFRRESGALFRDGRYVPLAASGRKSEFVCAFARSFRGAWALVAVPRLLSRVVPPGEFPLGRGAWGAEGLSLPAHAPSEWRNVFTGERLVARRTRSGSTLPLAGIFSQLPFALLAHGDSRS
ncbi:MAG TPA: malto-oligosyltrehalose synthase [Candidatus Acidoferrales bacterium]|nr:malto-oligosyltrehalose synthase [Candidatus Acidoferrales bacterium]